MLISRNISLVCLLLIVVLINFCEAWRGNRGRGGYYGGRGGGGGHHHNNYHNQGRYGPRGYLRNYYWDRYGGRGVGLFGK